MTLILPRPSYLIIALFLLLASGTAFSQLPTWNAAGKEGSNQPDGGRKVLSLPTGEAYVIGRFQPPSISFSGGYTLNTISGNDSYLLKYNPAGTIEWVIGIHGPALNEDVVGLALDPNGDVVFAGNFQDSVVIDGNKVFASGSLKQGAYVAKVSSFGIVKYAKEVGNTSSSVRLAGMSLDDLGNIYFAGDFSGSLNMSGINLPRYGGFDLFFAGADKNADALWAKSYGSVENDNMLGMDVAPNGNIYAAAFITHLVNFGGQITGSPGAESFVFLHMKSNGAVLQIDNQAGLSSQAQLTHVRATANNGVYLAGSFQNTVTINGTSYNSISGSRDGMVIKYDNSANLSWVRSAGGFSSDEINGLDVDVLGNAYVIGNFNGSANFNGTTITTSSFFGDAFVARYQANGNVQWAMPLGASSFNLASGYSISMNSIGQGIITGEFASTMNFGGTVINATGGADLFWAIFCQSPEVAINSTNTTTFCEGANISVPFTAQGCYDGSNVFELELSDASGSFATPTILASQTGTLSGTLSGTVPTGIVPGTGYRVRISASNPGYKSPDNGTDLTMSGIPTPTVQAAGSTQLCQGATVALSTTSSYAAYQWSDGSTSATVNAGTPGIWTVMVTNSSGCAGVDSIEITAVPVPNPTPVILPMGTVALCNGNPVSLDPGAGFTTYLWSDGSVNQTNIAATPGVYDVTVTNSYGCEGTSNAVTVVASQRPTIAQVVDTLFSSSANSYQWNLNGVAIPGATNAWYVPTTSGNYSVTVTTTYGCVEESDPFAVVMTSLHDAVSAHLNVYPNPANSNLTVEIPVSEFGKSVVTLTDIAGRTLRTLEMQGEQLKMEVAEFPAGFYILNIAGEKMTGSRKIQIVH